MHLKHARDAEARGELVLAGALGSPADGAGLLFRGDSPEVAERSGREDPYVTSGLSTRCSIRPWITVIGRDAATPVSHGEITIEREQPPEKGPCLRSS